MRTCGRPIAVLLCFLACSLGELCAQVSVEGIVQDRSGAVIAGASVSLCTRTSQETTGTNSQGRYSIVGILSAEGTIDIEARGFRPAHRTWAASGGLLQLDFTLDPASPGEQVVVSAARTEVRLADTPGSTILLSNTDLAATAALRVDDVLRQVPGFSLFRRSDSRTANASNQGVSLRGLGGTAASRALVLADGIPLVDPFGGWVYWDRVPKAALADVEVYRGGASNLYGSDALGGVVQLLTRQPAAPAFNLETSFGNESTPDLSLWAGTVLGKWDLSATTELFRTDGFVLVSDSLRGSVDTPANSEDATVYTRIGHQVGNNGRVLAQGNLFTEFRHNGTPIQTNDTRIGEGAVGLDKQLGTRDSVNARLFADVESFNQNFSAVAPDRMSESLTDIQHVPEQVGGGGVQWTHLLGNSQTLIGGFDFAEVIGASDEQLFAAGAHTRNKAAGGRQRMLGFFGEDLVRLQQKWTIILAARGDDWNNFSASSMATPLAPPGPLTTVVFPERSETAFSPRFSLLRSLNHHLTATASIYRAFRAPTLNELYRNFRVGNVLTEGNAALKAERLTGAEAGMNATVWDRRLNLRGTFFWSDIVDPVANVTLSTTPTLITREKENLGRTRSRGVELDGVFNLSQAIQLSAGYEYTDATVLSYPGNPGGVSLAGLDVPQVPHNVFTCEARYWNPSRLFVSAQGRFVSRQFDDDRNQFRLDRFYTMDFQIGRALKPGLEVFAAAENLLDQRYQVARTPIVNLGPPILFRAGLRLNYPATR